jgi:hypothetical protein
MVDPKIPSAQRKSRDAENAESAPEAKKSQVFFSAFSASLLFLCADGILGSTIIY